MKLLIVTQKVDRKDDNIGSFHRWVEEFARDTDEVVVIANAAGDFDLPKNVSLYSLEKEKGTHRVLRWWRFLIFFSREYAGADAVFFHMMPEFVIAASPFLVARRVPSALWYVHKSVTWKLRWAEWLVHYIFTASALSFRLPSKKVIYTGHAIDTAFFYPASQNPPGGIHLLTVGRISPIKDIETIIRACAILKSAWDRPWSCTVVGGPAMARDVKYFESLVSFVRSLGLESFVHFNGAVSYLETPEIYRTHDMFLSMSTTGSIDKAVLEAMSSGLSVITANEAFKEILPVRSFLELRSPEALAERIKALANENRPNIGLRTIVQEHHSVGRTVKEIIKRLSSYA